MPPFFTSPAALPEKPEPMNQSFQRDLERLHQLTVYGRWAIVAILWLTVGSASLWGLRYPISLLHDYFTWSALRYGLAFHPLPAVGLAFCIGMTLSVLVWQSRNILVGLPARETERLKRQVHQIRQQGPSHPLWKWLRN
ncbi:MAG: hypothetical protein ACKO24_16635 [Leptolyngbyaceae cyanobacterium]